MPICEFCQEFGTGGPARFSEIYRGVAASRVVARTSRFVAIPTLGQLFEGSLLVLPIAHIETCSGLDADARSEMLGLIGDMLVRVATFGHPVYFEHGATEASAGGCGIHHAHLHIVPLPREAAPHALFPEAEQRFERLAAAWIALQGVDHYLLFGDTNETRVHDLRTEPNRFPSQFFRRRLVEHFELNAPWDWRAYDHVEPALVRTLAGAALNAG